MEKKCGQKALDVTRCQTSGQDLDHATLWRKGIQKRSIYQL